MFCFIQVGGGNPEEKKNQEFTLPKFRIPLPHAMKNKVRVHLNYVPYTQHSLWVWWAESPAKRETYFLWQSVQAVGVDL